MKDTAQRIGKRFLADIKRDDISGLGAELAYRFLFAVFPFGIFVAALTAFVAPMLGFDDPTGRILGAIGDNLPADVAAGIKPQLEAVIGTARPGLLTVGAVAALWAATGGTNALMKAMNRAYEVEESRPFFPRTALAIGLTLLATVGVLAAFVTIVGASLLSSEVARQLELDPAVVGAIGLLRWPVVFVGLSLAVGVLYKLAPNVRVPWRWSFAAGALFAVAWIVATAAFGLYVANFANYSNTYGALGGVVVLMLWFYLSSIVLVGSGALVASALKELEPEVYAAGKAAAAASTGEATAHQERAVEALKRGRPIEAADGVAAATATGIEASAREGVEPTATPSVAPRTATTQAPSHVPARARASASASALRRSAGRTGAEPSGPLDWAATGVAVAAGVAVGALAARLFGGPNR